MTPTSKMPALVLCEFDDASADGVPSHSPFCVKVHAALAVLDLPYERRHLERPDAAKAFNATGQVPVLLVDGVAVPDSTRILAKLDELTQGGLYRRVDGVVDPEDRLWEELADTSLNAFLVASRWADDRNWPLVREAYFAGVPRPLRRFVSGKVRGHVVGTLVAREVWRRSSEDCWDRFTSLLDDLERRSPSRGFWLGETIGAADLGLYGQLRSFQTRLTPWQSNEVSRRPRLAAYVARVEGRTIALRAAA